MSWFCTRRRQGPGFIPSMDLSLPGSTLKSYLKLREKCQSLRWLHLWFISWPSLLFLDTHASSLQQWCFYFCSFQVYSKTCKAAKIQSKGLVKKKKHMTKIKSSSKTQPTLFLILPKCGKTKQSNTTFISY